MVHLFAWKIKDIPGYILGFIPGPFWCGENSTLWEQAFQNAPACTLFKLGKQVFWKWYLNICPTATKSVHTVLLSCAWWSNSLCTCAYCCVTQNTLTTRGLAEELQHFQSLIWKQFCLQQVRRKRGPRTDCPGCVSSSYLQASLFINPSLLP